jgi:hypothetical protein
MSCVFSTLLNTRNELTIFQTPSIEEEKEGVKNFPTYHSRGGMIKIRGK